MDSNIDSTITKIYENQQTMNGTEEEAEQYLQVLEQHPELSVSFEDPDFPTKFSSKSWERIIQLMDEEKKYSLAFIVFSMTNEVEESDIWGIRKNAQTGESGDEVVLQDVFFNTVLDASAPHDVPFIMCEDDFSQFTDYFNQKEAKSRKIQLSNEDSLQLKGKELDGMQIKEEENQPVEVVTKVIEDKDGVKREVTTKTTSSTVVYQKPIHKMKEEISKPVQEILRGKAPTKGPREQKIDISKPSEVTISKVVQEGEPQTTYRKKRIITKNGKKQVFEEVPGDEIIYKIIYVVEKRKPKTKVIKKIKIIKDGKEEESEEEIPENVVLYEAGKPQEGQYKVKIIRRRYIIKDGKEEEIEEELPNEGIIYKTIKSGTKKAPHTKIVKITIVNGREREEEIPGDEMVLKTIKYGEEGKPAIKIIRRIIIMKEGKVQEIIEEVPEEDILFLKSIKYDEEVEHRLPGEEVVYKTTKYIQEGEPEKQVIRKQIITKDGKGQEFEEVPEEKVIYRIIETGEGKALRTKVIKKKTIIKDGKEEENEEEVPENKVLYETVKPQEGQPKFNQEEEDSLKQKSLERQLLMVKRKMKIYLEMKW